MKISIITINKNNAKGLTRTIASVKSENSDLLEFIVVDGASTDESLAVIDANSDIIDHLISEPDSGIYDAMNKGINLAKGDYILFLNSGDILYNSTVLEAFISKNYTEDFVLGGVCFVHNSRRLESYLPDSMNFFDFLEGVCHQSTFIKRTIFSNVGKYDTKYKITADWALLIKSVILENHSYTTHKKLVSYYNLDGISSSSNSKFKVQKEKKAFLCEHNLKYSKLLFAIYRFSFRILRIRFFYIKSQL